LFQFLNFVKYLIIIYIDLKNVLNSKYLASYWGILLIQTILFVPFLINGDISSDWDSYASLASGKILLNEFQYIPSRPPGFPVYEIFLGFLSLLPNNLIIFIHFLISLFFTAYIYKSIPDSKFKPIYSLIVFTSHVYLISAFSTIDYVFGAFFGFAFLQNLKKEKYLYSYIFIILSCGIRLSNLIFLVAGFAFLLLQKKEMKTIFLISTSIVPILILYVPSYLLGGGVCFLNLTNVDHTLYERLGRYFYKQLQVFGILGTFLLFFYFLKNLKNIDFKNPDKVVMSIIFVAFQLSFLRLPTEKGHLLPALICFLYLISDLDIKASVLYFVLVSSFVSNFLSVEFLEPDIPNHANTADFGVFIEEGYLLQDLKNRAEKGKDFDFNIDNAIFSIKEAWNNAAPNC